MSEKRFICGLGFPINSNDPIRIISDSIEDKDYYKFSDICNILNKQQATIEMYQRSIERREEQISIIKKYCLKFLTDEQFEIIKKALEDELV